MAQQTTLSVMGIPGPVHSFSAKTAAVLVNKLFNLIQAQSLIDGAVAGQSRVDGAFRAQSLIDGAVEAQAEPT